MPICKHCGKDTEDTNTLTCFVGYIEYEDDTVFQNMPYPEDETERCSVCHVVPGAMHHRGCYMERCPRCGKRLVSCGCLIKNRGI